MNSLALAKLFCLARPERGEVIDEGMRKLFYQRIVEQMSQGLQAQERCTIFTVTLVWPTAPMPHFQLVGQPMTRFIAAASQGRFGQWLQEAIAANCQGEFVLQGPTPLDPGVCGDVALPMQSGEAIGPLHDLTEQNAAKSPKPRPVK